MNSELKAKLEDLESEVRHYARLNTTNSAQAFATLALAYAQASGK